MDFEKWVVSNVYKRTFFLFVCLFSPFIWGVELHRDHVQGVPRGDADTSKQAQEGNHPRLAVAKHQEETANAGNYTGAGCKGGEGALRRVKRHRRATGEPHARVRPPYPASLGAQFCPWAEPTRCCQATRLKCRGSWQSISCKHCWSRRWSPVCSPPCCGGRCCWSACSWQTCIWTSLMRDKWLR